MGCLSSKEVTAPPGKFEDVDWDDLPDDAKAAAETLGYSKETWDSDDQSPDTAKKEWKDLSDDQKKAAEVLGYDEDKWDN